MQKIVIIPDSFKGTISSSEAGKIIQEEARARWPEAEIIRAEVADGGEGSVDAFLSVLPGEKINVEATGPYGEKIQAYYGLFGKTAVVEMAAAAGLPLVGENLSAGRTTTFGVGELILDALGHGAEEIVLCLGGSATNDGGTGAAAALGVRFLDAEGECFVPVGDTLSRIAKIDMSGRDPRIGRVRITSMCDVNNPLCGENGAAAVYGPQKGATEQDIRHLEKGMQHLAGLVCKTLGKDIRYLEGGGAAGGMGAGAAVFLEADLKSGIEVILDTIHFDQMLESCSLVITGEGKLDGQSAKGKVVSGIAKRTARYGIPLLAIVGAIGDDADEIYETGVSAVFSIIRQPMTFAQIKQRTHSDLRKTARTIFQFAEIAKAL